MIRPIDIRLNAAHPDYPLTEAVTFTGSPSTVLVRGVPPNCGRWAITAVSVAATFPDGSTTTRAAVQSANGVWVATLPATARSGRTANGLRVMADGIDENGEAVTGYILGVADFAVASLGVTPAPQPGETSWQMLYFDAVPGTLRKGDVAKVDGVLKLYNGTAWEPFAGDIPAPSTATPAMDSGAGSAGSSAAYARGDHVHPTDTSRMAASATGADIPLNPSVGAPNLNSAVNILTTQIGEHVNDTTIHVTSAEKSTWNGKQNALTQSQLDNIAAVPSKANDADVVHKSGAETIAGAKTFTSNIIVSTGSQQVAYGSSIFVSGGATIGFPAESGTLALTADLRYALTTKTIDNGAVSLDDRASNSVTISATLSPNTLTVNFPTNTSGKVRDFAMRLNIAAGVTAPEIAWPQGVTLENKGGEVPEIADGGTGGSSTILYFSETENNGTTAKFLVKGETLVAITQA